MLFSQHFALLAIQIAIKAQPALEFVKQYSEEHTFSAVSQHSLRGVFTYFPHLEAGILTVIVNWKPPKREKYIITERIFYLK